MKITAESPVAGLQVAARETRAVGVAWNWRACEAALLLLAAGLLIGVNINISKAGALAGLLPIQIAFGASAGGGLLLWLWNRARGERLPLDRSHVIAYAALGLVSAAIPTILGVMVATHVGAGYASVVIALTPLLTLALVAGLGFDRLTLASLSGLLLGFAGALVLIGPGALAFQGDGAAWMLLGLVIPAANATGNILRTALVPQETPSEVVASGVLLAAAILLAPFVVASDATAAASFSGAGAISASALATALTGTALYRLQRVAGPVRLSQVGYIAAAFGVATAAAMFGEMPSVSLLIATVLIVAGITLVGRASPRRRA